MESSSKSSDQLSTNIQSIMNYLESKAYQELKQEDFAEALCTLDELEQVLESMVLNQKLEIPEYILSTLYNTALCHQKLNNFPKVIEYLDGAIFNLNNSNVMSPSSSISNIQKTADKIRKNKFHCRMLIQLCVFKSQMNHHVEAFHIAKKANQLAVQCIEDTLDIIKQSENQFKASQKKNQKNTKGFILFQILLSNKEQKTSDAMKKAQATKLNIKSIIQRTKPTLVTLINFLKGNKLEDTKCSPVDLRSPLGVESSDNWIFKYNIKESITLVPINVKEIQQTYTPHYELSVDFMLDKVIYYTDNSCRFKFLCNGFRNQICEKMSKLLFSQILHWQAMKVAKNFLPSKSPLVQHIISSFNKHYHETQQRGVQVKKYQSGRSKKPVSKSPDNRKSNKMQKNTSCKSPDLQLIHLDKYRTQQGSPLRTCLSSSPELNSAKSLSSQNKKQNPLKDKIFDYKKQKTERPKHLKNAKKKLNLIKSAEFAYETNLKNDYQQKVQHRKKTLNQDQKGQSNQKDKEQNILDLNIMKQKELNFNYFKTSKNQSTKENQTKSPQSKRQNNLNQQNIQSGNDLRQSKQNAGTGSTSQAVFDKNFLQKY